MAKSSKPVPEYDFMQTHLELHPEVAGQLGQYHAAFAIMEHEIYLVFARVLDTNVAGALSLLGTLQSFSAKTGAVKEFLPHCRLSDDDKGDCRAILAIANACNSFRNKLAHGQFGIDPSGELRLIPYSTSTGRNSTPERINETILSDRRTLDIDRLKSLIEMFRKGERFPEGMLLTPSIVRG